MKLRGREEGKVVEQGKGSQLAVDIRIPAKILSQIHSTS